MSLVSHHYRDHRERWEPGPAYGPRAGAGAAAADVPVIQTVHYGHRRPYTAGRVRASEQVNTAVGVKHYLLFVTNCSLLGGPSLPPAPGHPSVTLRQCQISLMFTRSPPTGPSHKPLTGKHRTVRSTSASLIDVNDS